MIRIAKSLAMIATVAALAVGATGAYFSDSVTSSGNTFGAGTLDLKVNDEDGPLTQQFTASNIAPGYDSGYKVFCLKNTGTLPGKPSVEFSAIVNSENGVNGPETTAEAQSYASSDGELGQYLKYTIGYGPCNWSVPSNLTSQWQTGPAHPWGIPGLNGLGGTTYSSIPVLNPGQTVGFFIKVSLDNDLRRWDGTKWLDVDDNIIQSDGAAFDMLFHLDQV